MVWLLSDGDTRGGGPPPFMRFVADIPDDVGIPIGILAGARMIGAPAGVGERMWGKAVIPGAIGEVMNRAASGSKNSIAFYLHLSKTQIYLITS